MSTMDYLEFKNHLEHSFTQADRAKEYKKQSQESVKRQGEVNQTFQSLKDAAIKDIMFYIKDYNNIIERDRQKIVKAKNMLNSPAGTQAKSSYVKTNSGQPSIREEIKVIEYWMNKNIERKEALEKELQEIRLDKTGKKAKAYVDGHKNDLHHSGLDDNLEHASMAGMPTTIKKDQQTQIRKEVIKKIDAYLNSSKFSNVTAEYFGKGGSEMRSKRGGGAIADREMRKAANKGAAADNSAKKNAYTDMLTYISNISGSASNRGLFTSDEMRLIYKLRDGSYGNVSHIAEKLKDSLSNSIEHSNLEHASIAGVPSRLRSKMQNAIYKKTGYQSKGSYAGAPNTAKQATTDQNKAAANARFSANIKSAIEACNRDAAEAQSVYVEATTRINNIVSRSRGEVNSIIRSVNEYNENVRNIRKQTITKKSTFATVANGKMYQGVRDEQVPVDPNRQFISFSAGAQKISANKYVYKPKMLLIDSDPGTYKEV